jgi:hypothetical protein
MTRQVSGNMLISSAPPLSSVRRAVATAERNIDITLHHTGDNYRKDASFEICSLCETSNYGLSPNRLSLTGLIGLGIFPSQLWLRAEVHWPPNVALSIANDGSPRLLDGVSLEARSSLDHAGH